MFKTIKRFRKIIIALVKTTLMLYKTFYRNEYTFGHIRVFVYIYILERFGKMLISLRLDFSVFQLDFSDFCFL